MLQVAFTAKLFDRWLLDLSFLVATIIIVRSNVPNTSGSICQMHIHLFDVRWQGRLKGFKCLVNEFICWDNWSPKYIILLEHLLQTLNTIYGTLRGLKEEKNCPKKIMFPNCDTIFQMHAAIIIPWFTDGLYVCTQIEPRTGMGLHAQWMAMMRTRCANESALCTFSA